MCGIVFSGAERSQGNWWIRSNVSNIGDTIPPVLVAAAPISAGRCQPNQ
jgi:hypothetical protein